MLRNLLAIFLLCGLIGQSFGQEKWSLEKCISYARQNSLTVKQAQFDLSSSNLELKTNQLSRLPNFSGRFDAGYNFGRTINPATNEFDQQSTGYNQVQMNAGLTLYGGNRINNSIKRSKINIEAGKLSINAAADNVGLLVAQSYLNILLSEEQLVNAQKQLELTEQELAQTDKLIEAGSVPYNDRLDILARIALNKQRIIEAQNQVRINYLDLKQTMQIEPTKEFVIEKPTIPAYEYADPDKFVLEKTFNYALNNLPSMQANELRLQSLELSENIAQSNLLPTVTLFGNISSNFANTIKDFGNPDRSNEIQVAGQPVGAIINGVDSEVSFIQTVGTVFPDRSYFDQLNDNFGQGFGVSVSIPIFSNFQNRASVEQARLNTLNQQVINQQAQQDLKSNIQRAIADARASKESLEAAQLSEEAAQAAYDNSKRRYELGAINTLEFITARNQLDQAQVEVIRAKYQYVFNLKVVEFYEGKTLTLN